VPYPTDYFVESGAYLKINEFSVNYDLTSKVKSKHISGFNAYISVNNPYTLTPYTGFTPELPGNQNEAGLEINIYPVSATYILGLNLNIK
jgi:TonB-dependent starch-binding outer membrane protein SusC